MGHLLITHVQTLLVLLEQALALIRLGRASEVLYGTSDQYPCVRFRCIWLERRDMRSDDAILSLFDQGLATRTAATLCFRATGSGKERDSLDTLNEMESYFRCTISESRNHNV